MLLQKMKRGLQSCATSGLLLSTLNEKMLPEYNQLDFFFKQRNNKPGSIDKKRQPSQNDPCNIRFDH